MVPFPWDDSIPIVADYHAALEAYAPRGIPGICVLGRATSPGASLLKSPRDADATSIVNASCRICGTATSFDLGGFELQFGAMDSQGSNEVFLTVIGPDGNYHPIDVMIAN